MKIIIAKLGTCFDVDKTTRLSKTSERFHCRNLSGCLLLEIDTSLLLLLLMLLFFFRFVFFFFSFICEQKNNEHMFECLPTVLLHAQVHSTAINPTTRGSVRVLVVLQAGGARSCDVATSHIQCVTSQTSPPLSVAIST